MGDARLYIFHQISIYLGEVPKRIWHIIFAFPGAVYQGIDSRARRLYKKMFQEAGIRGTGGRK